MSKQNLAVIHIQDLTIPAIIGTKKSERKIKQSLIFNIELFLDPKKIGKSDKLKDTIDYQKVIQTTRSFVAKTQYFLLEKLGSKLTDQLLKKYQPLGLKIRIQKQYKQPQIQTIIFTLEKWA